MILIFSDSKGDRPDQAIRSRSEGFGRRTRNESYESRTRALADVDVKELEVGATIVFFRGNGHDWLDAIEKACSFKRLDANTLFLKGCEKLAREIVD